MVPLASLCCAIEKPNRTASDTDTFARVGTAVSRYCKVGAPALANMTTEVMRRQDSHAMVKAEEEETRTSHVFSAIRPGNSGVHDQHTTAQTDRPLPSFGQAQHQTRGPRPSRKAG